MFNRWGFRGRPAFARGFDDAGEELGWQPWAQPERPHFGLSFRPHFRQFGPPFGAWHMMRRFPFGPGRGLSGSGGPGPRFFGRGDLKYGLLALLEERPKHGYEMIKELEERAGGFYTPSAGAVYPTLQLMEDRGWVTSREVDGKKVYTITDAGRDALKENRQQQETFGGPRGWGYGHGYGHGGPFGHQAQPELGALRQESAEVARLLWSSVMAAGGDPAKLARLRKIIAGTRNQLQEFLGQGQPGGEPTSQTSGQ